MKSAVVPLALIPMLVAGGCSTPLGPGTPALLALDPPTLVAGVATRARLLGRGLYLDLHVTLDDHAPLTSAGQWRVTIGGMPASAVTRVSSELLTTTLPALAPGVYELVAIAPWGEAAILPGGVRVVETGAVDGGIPDDLSGTVDMPAPADFAVPPDLAPPAITFGAPVAYVVGKEPVAVAVARMNADVNPDVVVANGGPANQGGASVSVLLGLGNGALQARPAVATLGPPTSLVAAIFTNTGFTDVMVGENAAQELLTGDNKGNIFTWKVLNLASSQHMIGVDLDGDQDLDIVHCNVLGNVISLIGQGNGMFQPPGTYPAGNNGDQLWDCVSGDFNNDQRPDVVAAVLNGNDVRLLAGQGNGAFAAATSIPVPASAFAIERGDLNGDGNLDIVVPLVNDPRIAVLPGDGKGGFGPPVFTANLACQNKTGLAVADLNGDGKLDVAQTCRGSNTMLLLRGDGTGLLALETTIAALPSPSNVTAADLDRDGKIDLVVNASTGNSVSVFLNTTSK